MVQRQRTGRTRDDELAIRDQEVLRANRELAAYFRGKRTEREARAALKIIKAFVRGREEMDPKNRPGLPGAKTKSGKKLSEPRRRSKARKPRSKGDEAAPPFESAVVKPSE